MTRFWVPLFAVAAMVLLPLSVNRIFLDTPIERQMGTAQKIFYFHVPMAWLMMAFAVTSGIAAAIHLRRGGPRSDAVALASAELAIVTGLCVLVTGPIWGHATWGKPWTWDARQVTTGLLWLVVCAYVLVRRYGAVGSERLAAALAIFAAADVPIIYYAVKIWKTTHPTTEVTGTLPPALRAALWPALLALTLVALVLLWARVAQELARARLDDAWIRLSDLETPAARGAGGDP